jgi:hypothetical protein
MVKCKRAQIEAVRYTDEEGSTCWAIEVNITEIDGSKTCLRASEPVSGNLYQRLGRRMMKAAGYDTCRTYSDFLSVYKVLCYVNEGTEETALNFLDRGIASLPYHRQNDMEPRPMLYKICMANLPY